MCARYLLSAIAVAGGLAVPPVAAQDQKVDVRTISCVELEKVDDGDRIAAIFFFYGFHAALLGVTDVSPANLERNVRNIVAFCRDNPATPIFEAVPRAFQR
jgi:hypothetical protein